MNEEWHSAHLDGELSAQEQAEFERALETDPELAAEYEAVAQVRALLRGEIVEPPAGAMERVVAAVAAADSRADHAADALAPVVTLESRRRVPTFAAVAAALVIIASVVGGLGGSTNLPALGEFVDQHQAAAAVLEGAPMPDDMADFDPMPMDEATTVSPAMPPDYSMEHAFVDGATIHLMYRTSAGEPVSVFRHEGDADLDDLGDGSFVRSDEAAMWSAPMDDTYVIVVDGTGYVWVVVSAEPHDDMMGDLMHDLPSRSPSLMERLKSAADAVVEPFRL